MKLRAVFPSELSRQPQRWSGEIVFSSEEPETATTVSIKLRGLVPHTYHAIHIHKGKLDASSQSCMDVGPHWNPLNKEHGSIVIGSERHAGDLCNNVVSDSSGKVSFSYLDPMINLWTRLFSPVGRTVVVHEQADDLGLGGLFLSHEGKGPCPPLITGKSCGSSSFVKYEDLSTTAIQNLNETLGYGDITSRKEGVKKLRSESKSTGNAGGRMACANIYVV